MEPHSSPCIDCQGSVTLFCANWATSKGATANGCLCHCSVVPMSGTYALCVQCLLGCMLKESRHSAWLMEGCEHRGLCHNPGTELRLGVST